MKDKFEREIDYLRVSVTDNCNLRCVYCMKEKENNFLKNDEKLTDDEIYKIVKESAKLGIKKIRMTGGEPLVRRDIKEILIYLRKVYNGKITLSTNGLLIDKENIETLKKCVDYFEISLDGVD